MDMPFNYNDIEHCPLQFFKCFPLLDLEKKFYSDLHRKT